MTTVVILTRDDLGPPSNLARLERLAEVRVCTAAGLADALPGADVLLWWDYFSPALAQAWGYADRLRWVHVASAGVDAVLFDELRDSDVLLSNARGVFDQPIAEFVLASVLAHLKDLPRLYRRQQERHWEHAETLRAAGRTALVVGTGGIGRATARLLKAVGFEVRGVGRTPRVTDPDFGQVVPSAELAEHVGWADHVVLAAPLTDQTRGLVERRVLAAMRPTAQLVNVGRGPLVVEADLIAALESGGIAAAALDVFETEPLPNDSPLWSLPGVQVSAHLSGDVVGWRDSLAEQFEQNLRRWVAGEELPSVVDKQRGYAS
ncbi:hydroxyacid dehydrogenase [Enemella dayhoffiae]|uniref:Hydroxyacid dehydrogenase n=1 Tax=Enemella dayhoffiae TaxID=2016507 RepID=A0A255GZA3_9ACTN|nr:D-2-hydroxyacid dehydrogenase [Enemella dayhoffiae]OYO20941.1 hydroxyacid dehydrogenase [Enemella dayhoffiae]